MELALAFIATSVLGVLISIAVVTVIPNLVLAGLVAAVLSAPTRLAILPKALKAF
ncbi:MAG: hypothetical protein WA884_11375 [Methyloceanibacter sp.]